jgi:hypothetical protein
MSPSAPPVNEYNTVRLCALAIGEIPNAIRMNRERIDRKGEDFMVRSLE